MVVPHCLMWCIWKERNSRCFENNERSMPDLKLLFFRTLLDCFSMWRNQPFSSILDLLDLCNFCIWYVYPYILPVYLGVFLFLISINLYYLSKKSSKWFSLSRTLKLTLIDSFTLCFVWFGVFGRKEIVGVLKTMSVLCLISSFYFLELY